MGRWESALWDHSPGAFLFSQNTPSPSVCVSLGDSDNICFTCLLTYMSIWDAITNRNLHIHHSIGPWGTANFLLANFKDLKFPHISLFSPYIPPTYCRSAFDRTTDEVGSWRYLPCLFYSDEVTSPYFISFAYQRTTKTSCSFNLLSVKQFLKITVTTHFIIFF